MQNRPPASLSFAFLLAAALIAPAILSGCGLFTSSGGKGKMIPADYHGLEDQSLAIIIYTAQANTDEFPGARKELSAYISAQMKLHLPTTRLLDSQEVLNWQDDTINWYALPPKDMGKHFSVDRVLYIEVLTYEARADGSYGDFQGHLRCSCKIFDVNSPGAEPAWSGVIESLWPRDNPITSTQSNEITVRSRTLQNFATDLVEHFFDNHHTDIPLKDR